MVKDIARDNSYSPVVIDKLINKNRFGHFVKIRFLSNLNDWLYNYLYGHCLNVGSDANFFTQ